MSYISAIGIATPEHKYNQACLADYMANAMHVDKNSIRKIRTVFRASGIKYRYSVLRDFGNSDTFDLFPKTTDDPTPGTDKRMQLYRTHALPLCDNAITDLVHSHPGFAVQTVTHLIVVSCTGMYAPGLDIDIIKHLKLPTSTERTCINFMGCYAAFNGIKTADAICKSSPGAKVLILCVELCSLHFQSSSSDDNILANALFGDGAAAILVEGNKTTSRSFSLERFHNDLSSNGADDMAWSITDYGFKMRLTSYIPDLLRSEIQKLIGTLLEKIQKKKADIKYFALHPGGKKILEAIEEELQISREQNRFAYQVLQDYGNMSSPTVVFVLKKIFDQLSHADNNEWILAAAFGPGLTLESMLLKAEVDDGPGV